MNTLLKLTWIEIKLFIREPITMVFTFALPLLFLFVMGGVFGNVPEEGVFRDVGPLNYYTPAYIGLTIASIGLVSLPVHLTAYRERGVLRRLRASSISIWIIFGSQLIVTLIISAIGGALIFIAALLTYDVSQPESPLLIPPAFIISVFCFSAIGVFLGAMLPTTRAAQGIGMILFFVMLILGGAGPPYEVMTKPMQYIGNATPLHHVITLIQDPWLGFGWNNIELGIVVAFIAGAMLLSVLLFRWE